MVKSEGYQIDDYCNGRKSSCDEDDVGVHPEWSPGNRTTNPQSHNRGMERKEKVCDLLLVQGNSTENVDVRNIGNDSILSSSSSSSTSNEGAGAQMLLLPLDNHKESSNVGTLDDKRLRRQIANCNERRRMQSINAGFQALRQLLPYKEGEKMSKAAILQQTADFIHNLQEEKDRLSEENELIAQTKKRRIENSLNNDDRMDISEESSVGEITNGRSANGNETTTTLDVLECLKTIQELRKELLKEQQLRMVYERELRNKSSAPIAYGVENAAPFAKNKITVSAGFPSALHVDAAPNSVVAYKEGNITENYQHMLIGSHNQQQSSAPSHTMVSAFSAISTLQDALNAASPLISTQQPTVINTVHNVLANSSKTQRTTQPQVVIQTALPESLSHAGIAGAGTTTLPSTIIVNDSGIGSAGVAPTTITFALASDTASANLGSTANLQSIQPAHVVLDVANAAGNRFITLNRNHSTSQRNPLIIDTSSVTPPSVPELKNVPGAAPVIIATGGQNLSQLSHRLATYPNNGGNMLMQVDPRQSESNAISNGISELSNYTMPATSLTSPKMPTQTECTSSSLSSATLHGLPVAIERNFESHHHLPSTTTAAEVTSSNGGGSASLSQRNLQAILDAIRHIEGGSMASAAAVAIGNNSSSSSCSQASDLLVR